MRRSPLAYELYVRIVYTIFGCLLTLATLATFAHYSASGTAAVINYMNNIIYGDAVRCTPRAILPFGTDPVNYLIKKTKPCMVLGIAAAAASAIVTNCLLKHHNDFGIVFQSILHIAIDSLTIGITLAIIPNISEWMEITELYQR